MLTLNFLILTLIFVVYNVHCTTKVTQSSEKTTQNTRNKRLLFYDEEGNIVKTFTNPLRDIYPRPETYPFFENFLRPFQNYLLPQNSGKFTSYMIPVSEDVIQQVNQDPMYQNKVLIMSTKEPSIEPNFLCNGKRTQIPSPNSCKNFLNCWDGWAFEQECPEGLMFSEQGFCDYAFKVDCGSRRLIDAAGPLVPQCSKDFEAFRNEAKCGEFFVCVNRLPVRFNCPADLYYNEKLGICDYPYRVECSASLSLKPLLPPLPSNDMPVSNPEPSPSMATSQAPVTKILYGDDMAPVKATAPVAMSRQDAIRMLHLRP